MQRSSRIRTQRRARIGEAVSRAMGGRASASRRDRDANDTDTAASDGGLHSPRKPLMSGNWKMHMDHFEAVQTVQRLAYALAKTDYEHVDVSVHPPFTAMRSVQVVLMTDEIPIALGAQDCHPENSGAFTGEISPAMLAKLGALYVIAGHSERRALFGETDELVNAKVKAVLSHQMTPILCVGETSQQRRDGSAETVVSAQVDGGLNGLEPETVAGLVVAYEPIWAIGTGDTATPADAQAMCAHIRSHVGQRWGSETAEGLRIQYGGSVKPSNAADLMTQPDIDGALVGGASLDPADFALIANYRLRF